MIEKFIRFIVDNSHFTLLLILVVIVYGLSSISSLRIAQEPEIQAPKLWVELLLPGSSATEMEKNVIFPIEDKLKSLHQVKSTLAKVDAQIAYIDIEFEFGVDMNEKVRDIESRINNIKRTLPRELFYSVHQSIYSDVVTAFLIAVDDPQSDSQIMAFNLVENLQQIQRLKNISVMKADENIVISLDMEKLHWYGIKASQIASAIVSQNTFTPEGKIEIGERSIRVSGYKSLVKEQQDLGKTVVYTSEARPIKLAALAVIEKRAQQDPLITRYQSKTASFIKMGVDPQVNILTVRDQIDAVLTEFKKEHGAHIELDLIFDQSEGVWQILFNLANSLLLGMAILLLVLLVSVGYRSMFIISTILPLSFLFTIIGLSYTGHGIQQVSIAGFIIAMGLIVDNGIVVSENAFILQRYHGYNRSEAAIKGTAMAVSPLISSTLTTMLAFAPLFLLYSDEGLYLRSLTLSIWFSLGASLFVAVTLITLMLAKIGTYREVPFLPTPPSFLIALMPFRDKVYTKLIYFILKWRFLTLFVFVAFFVYALSLAIKLPVQIFPPIGSPYFTININVPIGTSLQKKQWLAQQVEQKIKPLSAVKSVTTLAGTAFPRIDASINFKGDIILLVKTQSGKESYLKDLMTEVKQILQPLILYGDISLSLFQIQDLDYQSDFTIELSGKNIDQLKQFAKQIHNTIKSVEGVETIINPMQSEQLVLKIDFLSEQALQLGVAKSDVDYLISLLTYGMEIDRFRDGRGKEFPLVLKIDPDPDDPMAIFRLIEVNTQAGGKVPLSEVLKVRYMPGESKILHRQFKPVIEIDCYIDVNRQASLIAQQVLKAIQADTIPDGIMVDIGGALKSSQQTVSNFGRNVALIGALIFSIFVIQFRSFLQPLIIFTAVPMSIIGAIIALSLSGLPISFFAAVGITSLMGIVVNDSILLVDEANQILVEQPQKSLQEIALEAGQKRFMPVLLTSVTTIAGLIPLALSESMFKSMAVAIIGGLISSTLLILLLVPALYSLLSRKDSNAKTL